MEQRRFPIASGLILGAALAGFFDGIVLHQILQWHHMICIEAYCIDKTVATLQRQTFYDGLFHAGMLLLLLVGLFFLVRERSLDFAFAPRRFWGSVLLGGGVFNILEGIIDHHILQIHHVRFGPNRPTWDFGFLVLGAALAVVGLLLTVGGRSSVAPGSEDGTRVVGGSGKS